MNGTDTYTQLGQVGVNTVGDGADDQLGTLTVDDSALTDALNTNYDAVISLFTNDYNGYSNNQYVNFYQASSLLTKPGQYDVQADFDSSGNLIAGRIKGAGDTTYRNATVDPPYISGLSGNPEAGLWVKAQWDGSSTTQSATIRVTEGVANQMADLLDQVMDSRTGVLHNAVKGDQDIISGIDDQITAAQDRLNDLTDQLKAQYAKLESSLAEMQAQQQSISSMASSLSATA